ncbi:MAG: FGGY-family carbohydrate kinase [Caldilineaceae bacterium]
MGLSADTTCCTVVAHGRGLPALRPAIIWMDVRAADQANRIAATGHPALKYNGFGNVSAEWMPCKALWLKEREPETYAKARYIGEFQDWLTQRLTGEWVASINNTSRAGTTTAAKAAGPRISRPSVWTTSSPSSRPRCWTWAWSRARCADVAADLGLPAGIPVAEGGADAFVAMFGLNVVAPGKMAFITGSSHLMLGQSATGFHAKGIFGTYPDGLLPGQFTVEGGQVSTGSVVKWFRFNFCGSRLAAALDRGEVDTYTILNEKAANVPIGSEGLIVLDYWQGNRTPYVDPEARGIMRGFSLKHTSGHVFRAILEGIAYGTDTSSASCANGYAVRRW